MGEGGARWTCADAKMEMGRRVCQSAETERACKRGRDLPSMVVPQSECSYSGSRGGGGGSQVGMLRVEDGEQASEVEPWLEAHESHRDTLGLFGVDQSPCGLLRLRRASFNGIELPGSGGDRVWFFLSCVQSSAVLSRVVSAQLLGEQSLRASPGLCCRSSFSSHSQATLNSQRAPPYLGGFTSLSTTR